MGAEALFNLGLWALRILFLLLVYLLLFQSISALQKALAREPAQQKGLAYLVVASAPDGTARRGRRFPLQAVTSVGRDAGNDLVLPDDFCSAQHALLSFDGSRWWLEDRGSTNGSFVNGVRAERPLPVHYGDEVEVGRVRLRLEHA